MTYDVADRLAHMRRRRGLSQGELARKLGLSRQAVSKWERGESSPDTENLVALADLYGVSLDELVRPSAGVTEEDAAALDLPEAGEGDPEEFGELEECEGFESRDASEQSEASEVRDASEQLEEPGIDDSCQPQDAESSARPEHSEEPEVQETPAETSHPVRVWTRRAAVGVGLVAAFSAGAYLMLGEVRFLNWSFDFKTALKRLLGRPLVAELDLNTAGITRIVLEWPAGNVEIHDGLTGYPLSIEERSPDGIKTINHEVEGSTLHLWSGDPRGWNDPSFGRDLEIWVPAASDKDERGYPRKTWTIDTIELSTASATFCVWRNPARRLVAALQNGSLIDQPPRPAELEDYPFDHGLEVEELDLDIGHGIVHVAAPSRTLKATIDGGEAYVALSSGAREAGQAFDANVAVASGRFCVWQPNPAEGWTAQVDFATDARPDARFASSFENVEHDKTTGTFRHLGDPTVQNGDSPLVRTSEEITYDVTLTSGTFELCASSWWDQDLDTPIPDKATTLAP